MDGGRPTPQAYGIWGRAPANQVLTESSGLILGRGLPGALGDARQLATVGHLTKAHAAQAELAVDGVGPAATLAAGVTAHRELGLAGGLFDQSLLRHGQFSLNGKPR